MTAGWPRGTSVKRRIGEQRRQGLVDVGAGVPSPPGWFRTRAAPRSQASEVPDMDATTGGAGSTKGRTRTRTPRPTPRPSTAAAVMARMPRPRSSTSALRSWIAAAAGGGRHHRGRVPAMRPPRPRARGEAPHRDISATADRRRPSPPAPGKVYGGRHRFAAGRDQGRRRNAVAARPQPARPARRLPAGAARRGAVAAGCGLIFDQGFLESPELVEERRFQPVSRGDRPTVAGHGTILGSGDEFEGRKLDVRHRETRDGSNRSGVSAAGPGVG